MGKRGPAPKPTALRVLHGDRKDRINTDEPIPAQGEVRCPAWLSTRAKHVWRRLAPDLIAKGVLTTWDVDLFADFCAMTVFNRDALEDMDRNGHRVVTVSRELSDGTLIYDTVKNPNWQIARESAAVMTTIGARFGLTPSDRAGLSLSTKPEAAGAERLLS